MTPRRIGLCILVGVALSASCTCPGPPCTLPLAGVDGGVYLDHSPATVRLVQPVPYGCDDQVNVERVTSEVRDESNQSIPAEVAHEQAEQQLNIDVSFQTQAPGWYYLRTQIEPALANIQGEVLVARNRLAVEPLTTAQSCSRVHVTASSTFICDSVAYRDGGVVPGLNATLADVRGDALWVWDSGLLRRWLDSPAGLSVDPSSGLPMTNKPVVMTASNDGLELFGATLAEAFRVAVRNGALTKLSSIALGSAMTPDVAFASNGTLFIGDAPAATTPLATAKTQVCAYSLDNDLVTKVGNCEFISGVPLGVVDDALWLREEGFLKVMQGDSSHRLATVTTLRPPQAPVRAQSTPSTTVLEVAGGAGFVAARYLNGSAFFDRYQDVPTLPATVGGSPTAVFFSGTGGTRIFVR